MQCLLGRTDRTGDLRDARDLAGSDHGGRLGATGTRGWIAAPQAYPVLVPLQGSQSCLMTALQMGYLTGRREVAYSATEACLLFTRSRGAVLPYGYDGPYVPSGYWVPPGWVLPPPGYGLPGPPPPPGYGR